MYILVSMQFVNITLSSLGLEHPTSIHLCRTDISARFSMSDPCLHCMQSVNITSQPTTSGISKVHVFSYIHVCRTGLSARASMSEPCIADPILVLSTLARSLRSVEYLVCMGPDRCGVHKVWRLHPSASLLVLLCRKPSPEGGASPAPRRRLRSREYTLCLKGWMHNAGKQCASYLCMRLSPDPCLCSDIYRSG
jgi:hypothetical protein